MGNSREWQPRAVEILSLDEVARVAADLRFRARRSPMQERNLAVFRLATCAGLRANEIAGLQLRHVRLSVRRPYIHVPGTIAKYGKDRDVPLWWDDDTGRDLCEWANTRTLAHHARPGDVFICSTIRGHVGQAINRHQVRRAFLVACRVLGRDRVAELTTHSGRHSFCSLALAGGRTLAEVRDAAGHSSVSVTNTYLHAIEQLRGVDAPARLFSRADAPIVTVRRLTPAKARGATSR